jgi:hypothetical protein
MKTKVGFLIFAVSFASMAIGQQASISQPSPAQAQPAPCVTTPTAPNPSGSNAGFKVPGKWRQALDKQRQQIEKTTGISVPDVATDTQQAANAKPVPCPPPANSPKAPPSIQAPVLKLPPDTTVTLHCNPMTPSPKDANGRPTTLTLPDPHDYALPKANDFEVDSVVPDLAAKTPCYLVKVDPKTNKSFVAQ